MKIGILTLHDSINYGALLQAYALASVYRSLGHEVCLVDRRRNPLGWPLKWELASEPPFRRVAWFLNATGLGHEWLRRRRTLRFLRERIGLTPYHFQSWADAPRDLGLDLVSVGSDQVWNAGINDPLDYMPGRIPPDVHAISYAASVGAAEFPEDRRAALAAALARFAAVSVREETSVALLASMGIAARHVVDPVVLAGRPCWDALMGPKLPAPSNRIVVYLLGMYLPPQIDEMIDRLMKDGDEVDLFVGVFVVEPLTRHGHPRLFKNLKFWRHCRRNPHVHIHLADGPESFVRALATASAVITNSYHALVFAALYDRNVRYLLPDASTPQHAMMVRVRDYAGSIVSGPLLQPTLASAWASVSSGERTHADLDELERRRQASLDWLKGVL